ncbi:MAG: hypothetical protein KBC02_02575 [Candidatus Pacebacteria bacterium]|nr:hypothetical protein [Candidatus Paceibacterota bacterium]
MSKIFSPMTQVEEFQMLAHDDGRLSATTRYLENLILSALSIFSGDEHEKTRALKNLRDVIPLVVSRYLGNPKSKQHKFSVYYSWYIHEEFKKYRWKRIRRPSQ